MPSSLVENEPHTLPDGWQRSSIGGLLVVDEAPTCHRSVGAVALVWPAFLLTDHLLIVVSPLAAAAKASCDARARYGRQTRVYSFTKPLAGEFRMSRRPEG
jgi:hypothetical protein